MPALSGTKKWWYLEMIPSSFTRQRMSTQFMRHKIPPWRTIDLHRRSSPSRTKQTFSLSERLSQYSVVSPFVFWFLLLMPRLLRPVLLVSQQNSMPVRKLERTYCNANTLFYRICFLFYSIHLSFDFHSLSATIWTILRHIWQETYAVPSNGYIHDWQPSSWILEESKPGDSIQR